MKFVSYVVIVCDLILQVSELALVKLFDNFTIKELVVSMYDLIVTSHATPPQVTPPRGSITVSPIIVSW